MQFTILALVLVLQDQNVFSKSSQCPSLNVERESSPYCSINCLEIGKVLTSDLEGEQIASKFYRDKARRLINSLVYHRSYAIREEKMKCWKFARLLSKRSFQLRLPRSCRSSQTFLYLCKGSFRCRHPEVTYFMKRETETRCCRKAPIRILFPHFFECFFSCTLPGYEQTS